MKTDDLGVHLLPGETSVFLLFLAGLAMVVGSLVGLVIVIWWVIDG